MAKRTQRPSDGSKFFIPAEEWKNPAGMHTIMANQISLKEAMDIAKKSSWNNIGYQKNLSRILSVYPNMSADVANTFARMGYDQNNAAVRAGAELDTIQSSLRGFNSDGKYDSSEVMQALGMLSKDKSNADLNDHNDAAWFAGTKWASRNVFAFLMSPLQTVTQGARTFVRNMEVRGDNPLSSFFGAVFNKGTYTQSTFAKMLGGADSGQGYFAAGDAEKQSEEQARQTMTIQGHNDIAWTLGRSIAAYASDDPSSRMFRTLSGVIDGVVFVVADPTIIGGKIFAGAKAARLAGKAAEAAKAGTSAVTTTEAAARAAERLKAAQSLRNISKADLEKSYREIAAQAKERDLMYVAGAGTADAEALTQRYIDSGVLTMRDELTKINDDLKVVKQAIKSGPNPVADDILSRMAPGTDYSTAEKLLKKARLEKNKEIKERLVDIHSTPEERAILDAAKQKYVRDKFDVEMKMAEKSTLAQRLKAFEENGIGLSKTADELNADRVKAIEWFAGKRGEDYLNFIANTDDARLINKISKGRFGATLSDRLARAKTLTEVEDVLLPHLGIDVNSLIPRGFLGRYSIARFPSIVLRPINALRVERKFNGLRNAINYGLAKMPNGRYINFNDTDHLIEQTERWMIASKASDEDIAKMYDDILNTSPDDFAARSRIVFNVLGKAVTDTAKRFNLSNDDVGRLWRSVKAYETAKSGEVAYHSQAFAESGANGLVINMRTIDGRDMAVDLSHVANSASQLAQGIYLPSVVEMKRMGGRILRATRSIDSKLGKGEITTQTARKMMSAARILNDDVFKTAVLVFRGAYVIRNILEMGVRQYISGGKNIISNPVSYLSMIMGNPGAARKYLEKVGIKSGDSFLVDAMGRPFANQGFQRGIDQEWIDSFSNMMALRAVSSDARMASFAVRQGGWTTLRLVDKSPQSLSKFAEGMADLLMRHRTDAIKRTIAGGKLPSRFQKLVDSGTMTFEQAVSRMVAEGKFKDMNMVRNSVPQVQRVLNDDHGRMQFLFGHTNSLRNQIENDTLGVESLKNFIATDKVVDAEGKVLFQIGPDFEKNHRGLKKVILEELRNNDALVKRAMQIEIPYLDVSYTRGAGLKKVIDHFFEIAARIDSKVIYSPEYRMAYWNRMAELAPSLSKNAAKSISGSAFAKDIEKTKVSDGMEIVNYVKHNPAYAEIGEVASGKKPAGWMNAEEAHKVASMYASRHVATMFYDATERNNMTQALSLALPFVNAWQNTIIKWGSLGINSANAAMRVLPASKLFNTLQSKESNVIYDIFNTPHDASQGFIYEDKSGKKVFTVPWSGLLTTAFGAAGNPKMNDIALSLNSLNLAFSGGQLPGSDVGILPGVGPIATFGYQMLTPNSWKYSMPGFVQHIVEPYGPRRGLSVLENLLPGWSKNIIFSSQPEALARMGQQIMAWEATTNPKYKKLYDGTPLSVSDRTAMQNELARNAATMAKKQFVWQGIIKNISPGSPIYTYYAKNKNNESFIQFQMADALRKMIDSTGDFNAGWGMYAELFGREAILAATGSTTGQVFANSDSWDFAMKNSDLMDKYIEEIPYLFAGGDFSIQYASAMKARGKGRTLTTAEVMAEADSLMLSAVKGQLAMKAVKYGYPPSWIDDQMKTYKMDVLNGYQPERPINSGARANRIKRIIEMSSDPRVQQTAAGQGLRTWLPLYQSALSEAQTSGYKTLRSEDLAYVRMELDNRAREIGKSNPDFMNLYNRVFSYEINQ